MTVLRRSMALVAALAALAPTSAAAFDLDTEQAPFAIGPAVIPTIRNISQNGMDATLVIRSTLYFSNAWFDATAPYTNQSVGVFTRIPNRPAAEHTLRNQNIACFYASYHAANSLWPEQNVEWRDLLLDAGLDPDDDSTDLTTPVGIGNVAGAALVEAFENDGMNQLGTANGRTNYFREPYEDTTGYEPVNTGLTLRDPSRWQPAVVNRLGLFKVQQFVTPQYGRSQAYSFDDVDQFRLPKPEKSSWQTRPHQYRAQANEVLAIQRNLTDEQKMLAELFNDKINSLGFSTFVQSVVRGLSMRQTIELDFLNHVAAYDMGIVTWKEKRRYDAVRPFSAIRFLYRNQNIRAWGGPGKGTVNNVPGKHWNSYLPVADHPEYPSGSIAFCAAHAQSMRRYFGDDNFGWPVTFPAGSSFVEPGITPAVDTTYVFETWTEFEEVCGESRLWGGVHFRDAVERTVDLAHEVGDIASDYVLAHIDGTIADADDDSDCDSDGDSDHDSDSDSDSH